MCDVAGCDRWVLARGLCTAHYDRLTRTGAIGGVAVRADLRGVPVKERFYLKVNRDGPEGGYAAVGKCWIWVGAIDARTGYGRFHYDGKMAMAHRVAYLIEVGPIPPEHQVDHLCFNRPCVRYTHLEPVTVSENQRRVSAAGRDRWSRSRTEAR